MEPMSLTSSSTKLSSPGTPLSPVRPLLSIVVPTKNERDNVAALVERLEAALPTVAMEIIFVDESDDGTRELVEALAGRCSREVVLLRQARERSCGLGAAVVQGLRAARARGSASWTPTCSTRRSSIAALLERAEASDRRPRRREPVLRRRRRRGLRLRRARCALSLAPRLPHGCCSRGRLRGVTRPDERLLPRAARGARPRRAAAARLQDPARDPRPHAGLRVAEVSVHVRRARTPGSSKASIREGAIALPRRCVARLRASPASGSSALIGSGRQHRRCFAFSPTSLGLYYVVSAVIATQGSTLWNFALTEMWVFRDATGREARGRAHGDVLPDEQHRAGAARAAARAAHLGARDALRGLEHDLARWSSRSCASGWPTPGSGQRREPSEVEPRPFSYDIHGIVSVSSDVRLPELERFRVGGLIGEPPTSGSASGRCRPNGHRPAVHYREGPGRLGFGVDDRHRRSQSRPTASRLLRCARRTCSTRTWSSRSCAGPSPSAATRSCTRRASRAASARS